jgi:hypothetical protein
MLGNTFGTVTYDFYEIKTYTKSMIKMTKNGFMCLIFGHKDFDCFETPFCGRCFANFPFTKEMNEAQSDAEFYSAMLVFKRLYKKQAE